MIRPARREDAARIAEFWSPQIRDTMITFTTVEKSPEDLAAMIAEKQASGYAFLVAEEDGLVLGFASYGQFRTGPGYARACEHTIILAPEAKGRGLGRALLLAIEDHACAAGRHIMVAAVSGGNPAGRAFHAAMGYAEVGVLPEAGWKFDRYWDLILMQKILGPAA